MRNEQFPNFQFLIPNSTFPIPNSLIPHSLIPHSSFPNMMSIAFYWLIGWAILLIGRVALIVFLLPVEQLLADKESFPLAIWNILRFDFQTLSYLAALPLLTAVIAALTHKSAWWNNFVRWYFNIAYTILATLTIVDIGFYKNFHSHFNIVLFDFFNELPLTLLQTFWEDYPVVPALLCIISVFLVLHFWGKRMVQNPKSKAQGLRFKVQEPYNRNTVPTKHYFCGCMHERFSYRISITNRRYICIIGPANQ